MAPCGYLSSTMEVESMISMRELERAIAAEGVPACLYQSGGGCATIGVGNPAPSLDYPQDGDDFPYAVGVGNYWTDSAHPEELGSGPAHCPSHYWQLPGWDPDAYETEMWDGETVKEYAARIAAAYKRFAAAYPQLVGGAA